MTEAAIFLSANWEVLAALGAGVWAVASFLETRRRELAWRRTEFIIKQSEFLDTDAEMRDCTLILYGKHPTLTVDDYLRTVATSGPLEEADAELNIRFEKYLNFLWRISYAHLALGTIGSKDLCAFGAYLSAIENNTRLRRHCLDDGYEEIVTAAAKVSRH